MNSKHKLGTSIFLCSLALIGVTVSAAVMTANKKSALNANGVFGDTSDYTVVLDESNAYTSGSTKEVTTSSGSWQISFAYTNASSLSGGHVTLANGGTLVNTRDIISIDYLKVHCSGSGTLRFRTSYDGATWGGYANITDNEVYNLASNPYYIELSATGGSVNVYQATYQYTCVPNDKAQGTTVDIPGSETWDKVTDVDDLTAGDEVMFAEYYSTSSSYYVMFAETFSNNGTTYSYYLSGAAITVSNNQAQYDSDSHSKAVWTIGKSGDTFTFYSEAAGKYFDGPKGSYSNLGLVSSLASSSYWTITIDSGKSTVTSADGVTPGFRLSSSKPQFYGSSGKYGYLFKRHVTSGGQETTYDTPVDLVGFTVEDTNASGVYTANSVYSTDNGLVVRAKYSDGSTPLLDSTQYTYKVSKTQNGTAIDKTAAFGESGTFYVTVTYSTLLPQTISIQVSLPPATVTNVVASMTNTSYTTADVVVLNNNLSAAITSVDYYSTSSTTNVSYSDFAANGLTVTLMDPNGVAKSISTAFGTSGTWTLRVTHTATGLTSDVSLTVSAISVTNITVNNNTAVEVFVGKTVTLTVDVTPSNATDTSVTWSSSDESVATVTQSGVVTGVSVGSATITATANDGSSFYGSCTVNVSASTEPDKWELVKDSSLSAGDLIVIARTSRGVTAGTMSGTYLTSVSSTFDTTNEEITSLNEDSIIFTLGGSEGAWTLENSDGKLLGASSKSLYFDGSSTTDTWSISIDSTGEATIANNDSNNGVIMYNSSSPRFKTYATTFDQGEMPQIYRGTCSTPVYPTSITVTGNNAIAIGESSQLGVTYNPLNTNQKVFKWTSSNTAVATVSNEGLVEGLTAGTTTITAYAKANATDTVGTITDTFTVTVSAVAVTGVTLSPTAASVNVGSQTQLVPTVSPANATNKAVTWLTSNSSIATVSDGTVTGVAAGTATITVKTVDGNKQATCTITVNEQPTLSKTSLQYTYDDYTSNNYYDLDNCPLSGSPKLLIIPVWFTDSTTFINTSNRENVRNDIQKAYLGSTSDTGWNSVASFYTTESAGRMNLTGTVTSWYECGNATSTYYTDGDATTSLVTSATNWYFNNNSSDSRKNYDTNGDGHLDGVILIYAAPDYSSWNKSSYDNLWAYCYWMQGDNASTSSPTPNVFFWASYDFMYDSSTSSSRTGKTSYGGGDCSNCSIDAHTFIHEMGHVLGADDYYDYSNTYNPAGGFSMQDFNVGGHDAYSVMAFGWADPYIPTETMDITINDFQSSHDIILLSNHNSSIKSSSKSPFDEYMLLELYSPTGLNEFDSTYTYSGNYPKGPNVVGIRLWHVDARLTYRSGNKWSTSLVTNPNQGNVEHAMVNSYSGNYASDLGSSYYNYNLLQLIRNSTSATYKPTDNLSASSLFRANATYTQSTYSGQFVNGSNMNSGSALGWSFTVKSISGNSAVITVTKL